MCQDARAEEEQKVDARSLEQVPLFAGLSKKERERVARWADEIDVGPGAFLVEQGRFFHEFFVLLDGRVEVTKDGSPLTELGPGDFFGEIALVEDQRRTASVVASTPVHAIVMHQRDFEEMRQELPSVCDRIQRAIVERTGTQG
jgi:CRP-like cAMP-binding protein